MHTQFNSFTGRLHHCLVYWQGFFEQTLQYSTVKLTYSSKNNAGDFSFLPIIFFLQTHKKKKSKSTEIDSNKYHLPLQSPIYLILLCHRALLSYKKTSHTVLLGGNFLHYDEGKSFWVNHTYTVLLYKSNKMCICLQLK